jgi:cephalosporin-C deacetylase-like acetyl esterase
MKRAVCGTVLFLAITLVLSAMADHLVLQVEDFDGPWRKQMNISGFQGSGFCTSNANPEIADTAMTATVTVQKGGAHAVWVRAYTSENSNRALQVHVGGKALAKTHTGSERHWVWERAGDVDLKPGPVEVAVKDAADGFESADAVVVTDKKEYDPVMADEELTRWEVYGGNVPEEADALRFNIEACCDALLKRKDPASREDWEAAWGPLREELAAALGLDPMPERTPLNARVTGKADREGYTIENVVFESRPGFIVTANLYIPKGIKLSAPGMIVVAGHDMKNAKNCETYQEAQLGYVRQGFVVMAHDPIGQGERNVPGQGHNLGYGSLLVGQTNEGYIVWDTLRALDYLVTRPEVDTARIGLSGNSGGGENTFYTMPFDERFKVGGSFSFVCSYEQWIRHGGNHCICNHLPGIVHQMEEFEIVAMNAPRPFLFGNGNKDKIFPIAGTRDTLRRARQVYAMYDAEECVAAAEANLGHGWSQPLREAAYGWMNQWLKGEGDGSPVPEGDHGVNDPASPDVLCFEDGKVPADSETVVTLNRKLADEQRKTYADPPSTAEAWESRAAAWRNEIWSILGAEPAAFTPAAKQTKTFSWEGIEVEALAVATEPGMEVAALLLKPADASGPCPAVVFMHERGKENAKDDPVVLKLLASGTAVLALDPRGTGETEVHENHLTSDSICLGRPIFGQQVWDVMQAARYLGGRADTDGARVACHGRESGALLALYAAALGAPVERVVAERPLASYRFFLEDSQPQPISLCVPNILKVADVAQIAALAAPRQVTVLDAVGYGKQPLDVGAVQEELAFAAEVYRVCGVAEGFAVSGTAEDALGL